MNDRIPTCPKCGDDLKFLVVNGRREVIKCQKCKYNFDIKTPPRQFKLYNFKVTEDGNFLEV